MFNVLKKLFRPKPTAFEAAQQRLDLFIHACELFLQESKFSNSEKVNLAKYLIFLGAADCSSQLHFLSDVDFAKLTLAMFDKLGVNPPYRQLMLKYFLCMDKNILAKEAVIEGGSMFNKWINGNINIPLTIISMLENYQNEPNFPASPGKLYVDIENKSY